MLDCGGRAGNRGATNHGAPRLPGAHQLQAQGMVGLRAILPTRTAQEFVTNAGCDTEDS